jgi:hypothetical protein
MGALLSRYKAGKMSLALYNKLAPVVNEVVEQMEIMEEAHLGFTADGDVDHNQFYRIEDYIEWVMSDYSDDEQEIIRMMVNDRMGYEMPSEEPKNGPKKMCEMCGKREATVIADGTEHLCQECAGTWC